MRLSGFGSVLLLLLLLGCVTWGRAVGFGSGGRVVAQGPGGTLTSDGLNAYVEALEFCHSQLGSPKQFSAAERQQISQVFAQGFAGLPLEIQPALSNARATWTQYRQAWPQLNMEQKKEFAYEVLALAYGESAAPRTWATGLSSTSIN